VDSYFRVFRLCFYMRFSSLQRPKYSAQHGRGSCVLCCLNLSQINESCDFKPAYKVNSYLNRNYYRNLSTYLFLRLCFYENGYRYNYPFVPSKIPVCVYVCMYTLLSCVCVRARVHTHVRININCRF